MRFVCVSEALLDIACYQHHVVPLKEGKVPTLLVQDFTSVHDDVPVTIITDTGNAVRSTSIPQGNPLHVHYEGGYQ